MRYHLLFYVEEMQVEKKGACLRRSSDALCTRLAPHSQLSGDIMGISEAFGHVAHDSAALVEKQWIWR